MITFDTYAHIPHDFDGWCIIKYEYITACIKSCRLYHNEDGPAVIRNSGTKEWYIDYFRHRIGGPAIEFFDGSKGFYIHGREYSEQQYWIHPLMVSYVLERLFEKS